MVEGHGVSGPVPVDDMELLFTVLRRVRMRTVVCEFERVCTWRRTWCHQRQSSSRRPKSAALPWKSTSARLPVARGRLPNARELGTWSVETA